jgi:2',3'-cyclic-nucleotide 2'-phosphodiesterase (5'-nucleotidase family)
VVLDAGNALFKASASRDDVSRRRAEFILRTMGQLRTAAMAVGARDLAAGPEFLKKTAARAKVHLLSANLVDGRGALLFEPSMRTRIAGIRVGVLGISPLQSGAGMRGTPPVQAALGEARKLKGRVDLIIALAAVPYADALQLSKEAGDTIDLILQSHEARGVGIPQRNGGGAFVIPTGERGRQLARLELDLSGSGPWVEVGQKERDQQLIKGLDFQIAATRKRLEAASPGATNSLTQTLRSFENRRETLAKEIAGSSEKSGRLLKLDFLGLGAEYAGDPALKAQITVLEPEGPSL